MVRFRLADGQIQSGRQTYSGRQADIFRQANRQTDIFRQGDRQTDGHIQLGRQTDKFRQAGTVGHVETETD